MDIQSAVAQQAGVGRYTRLLAQHLGAAAGEDALRLFYFDFRRRGAPFETPGAVQKCCRWMPGRAVQGLWKHLPWPPFDGFAGSADLYHFPNFILPPLRQGKSVVTIHDVSFLRFPEFAEERNLAYLRSRINGTIRRADAIITDSQFSADEIRELLHVPADRIFPIHLGIDDTFGTVTASGRVRAFPPEWRLDRPYILTVGTIEPRKNLPFLIDVFERLTDYDGCLVMAGMRGWKYEPILERVARSPRAADIRHLDYVDDALLPSLYASADLFTVASQYEGFGFPPLEAMACGTPVVSSAGGSLPEVLGDAAVIVSDFEADRWAKTIRGVLSDAERRKTLIRRGREQARGYRWSDTARRTWDVYRQVLSHENRH